MLTPEHAAYLEAHAITADVALNAGVYSITGADELPEEFAWYGELAIPSIAYPWVSPKGVTVLQLHPDTAPEIDGEKRKYLIPKNAPTVLNTALIDPGARVLLVEGTKQHLAAASWAPPDTSVYGLVGCTGWVDNGAPIPDLAVVDGKEAVVIFDADLASNLEVWTAAAKLAEALKGEGAVEVAFVKLPAYGKAGLDDVLAGRDPERRQSYLERLIDAASSKLPGKPRGRAAKKKVTADEVGDRRRIVVTNDQLRVINEITGTLVERWSGTRLFNHGGVISRRNGHVIMPLDRGSFLKALQEVAVTVVETEDGDIFTWPQPYAVAAALTEAEFYAALHRISRTPFVRPDGTICQTPGYDVETGTYLVSDVEVDVPESPAPEQVQAAVTLIMEEWLGDMPFATTADRANALALVLTPVIRGLVPLAPLAVVDGLQMGVGKNLFADCIALMATGAPADPLPYSADNEETRKMITSVFRAGADLFVFDEAHVLEGAALARALTALTYNDRILGVSTLAAFPNRATWISLGNQVQIRGDVARRIYPIALRPTMANPETRDEECFRHPDLKEWTREHRAELLGAVLTIVRAWFAGSRPLSKRGAAFGSFEAWGKMVGGMVEHVAGLSDFLGNVAQWRSDSDFDTFYWIAHLHWLHDTFGDSDFLCGDVRAAILANRTLAEPPPGMESVTADDWTRVLGQRYARQKDKILGGYQLIRCQEVSHNNTHKWRVLNHNTSGDTGTGGKGGTAPATHVGEVCVVVPASNKERVHVLKREGRGDTPVTPATGSVAFDLETAGLELWSYGPGFVRLAGWRNPQGEIEVSADPVRLPVDGATLVGHNIWCFDLLALARWHGLDLRAVSAIDTKLLAFVNDPPPAKMNEGQIERHYSLDAVGERLLGVTKAGDIKAMARKHGGFDQIPLDDPDYVAYLRRDVELTEGLAAALPLTGYAIRENEIARVTAVMSLTGFRVDETLLGTRLEKAVATRERMLERLKALGLPSTKKDGKECKAPHSTEEGRAAIVAAFAELGVDLPLTAKGSPALDQKAMDLVAERHPKARRLAETVKSLNGVRSIYETVSANLTDGRVHPQISLRQATGRWSVTHPGLTVMGKRGGRHIEREIFIPEPGEIMISADLSQVDARAVAALSQDRAYLALFEPGIDAHAEIAHMVWGDRSRREDAKLAAHGWNYGLGVEGLARRAGVTIDTAHQFDQAMRERFPDLVRWRMEVRQQARSGELLDNGFGRKMRPDPDRAHTQGPALMGQGCARDILMEGLLRLDRSVWPMLRAVVHDEVVLSVPEDIVGDVEQVVVDALSFPWAPPGAGVPVQIVAGLVGRGRSWGSVYAKEVPT